jgi:hypothetical protein
LIGSLADLGADCLKQNVFAELRERSLPGFGMEIDRVNDCPINIENHGFDHKLSLSQLFRILTVVVS